MSDSQISASIKEKVGYLRTRDVRMTQAHFVFR